MTTKAEDGILVAEAEPRLPLANLMANPLNAETMTPKVEEAELEINIGSTGDDYTKGQREQDQAQGDWEMPGGRQAAQAQGPAPPQDHSLQGQTGARDDRIQEKNKTESTKEETDSTKTEIKADEPGMIHDIGVPLSRHEIAFSFTVQPTRSEQKDGG